MEVGALYTVYIGNETRNRCAHMLNINFKVVGLTGLWLELTTNYLENLVMFICIELICSTPVSSLMTGLQSDIEMLHF